MIEFKQIIERGARDYSGQDFFTIRDFAKAYEHFTDPEWDREPRQMIKIKLADGKNRSIRYVVPTSAPARVSLDRLRKPDSRLAWP